MTILSRGAVNGVESTSKGDFLPADSKGKIIFVYRELLPFGVGIYPSVLSDKDRVGSAIALVYFMFYIQIGEWLTKDTDIRHLFYQTFWIVVLMQPINAMAFLFDGFYKGLGFTQTLRNSFLIATFLGFFPIYFFVEHVYHWGLMGIWVALLTWMLFRGGILILHYKAFFVTQKGIIR